MHYCTVPEGVGEANICIEELHDKASILQDMTRMEAGRARQATDRPTKLGTHQQLQCPTKVWCSHCLLEILARQDHCANA